MYQVVSTRDTRAHARHDVTCRATDRSIAPRENKTTKNPQRLQAKKKRKIKTPEIAGKKEDENKQKKEGIFLNTIISIFEYHFDIFQCTYILIYTSKYMIGNACCITAAVLLQFHAIVLIISLPLHRTKV